jgi:hypothetical protein
MVVLHAKVLNTILEWSMIIQNVANIVASTGSAYKQVYPRVAMVRILFISHSH